MLRTLVVISTSSIVLAACFAEPGEPNTLFAGTPPPSGTPPAQGRFHPADWRNPTQHGPAAKTKQLDCRSCHGNDLTGGVGVSCDTCHTNGWRTNCTFCHGGTLEGSGAPPRDLLGETDPQRNSFRAHTSHVSEGIHAPFDCSECHKKPTDVTSPGHLFDDTPGRAEVDFSGGRSAQGQYLGEGRCANLYCHSDGRGNLGGYAHELPRPTCKTCHDVDYTGAHWEHLKEDLACEQCHGAFTPSLHVNGRVDLPLPTTISRSAGTCTGTCHGEPHQSREWKEDD